MDTRVRRQLQMISLVLVLGLGLGLLVQMMGRGGEPPGPTPAETVASDRVTTLVASAFGGWIPTTAELSTGARTVGGTETLTDVALAAPARTGLATLTAQASQRVAQKPEPLEAHVSVRDTVFEVDDDAGRSYVEVSAGVVLVRASAMDAIVYVKASVELDSATGEVVSFEASGLAEASGLG